MLNVTRARRRRVPAMHPIPSILVPDLVPSFQRRAANLALNSVVRSITTSIMTSIIAVTAIAISAGAATAQTVPREAPTDGVTPEVRQTAEARMAALDRIRVFGTDALVRDRSARMARAPMTFEPVSFDPAENRIPMDQNPAGGGGPHASHGWEPYNGPFGMAEAAHLLRRVVVGATWQEIEQAAAQGLDATVQQLLAPVAPPTPPGPWATEPVPDTSEWTQAMRDSLVDAYIERNNILRGWWPDVIMDSGPSATETMTHFWHDHFATGMDKVFYPQSMYTQNALLREHALGNFKDMTLAVSLDPAMLLWLDNQWNRVDDINENFARELLELFTLGVGNYTQQDVIEVARAFTGYVTWDGVTSFLAPWAHDYEDKTIFGYTGDWYAEDVIDLVFAQRQCARFVCDKLYRWFVDEYPDPLLIDELAHIFRVNQYEIRPVLETILMSSHFYDAEIRGSIITDGLDHYIGRTRTFGLAGQAQFADYMSNQREWMDWSMWTYGHILLDPPNVAGWPGYRTWINSYTLPWRKELSIALVEGEIYGWPLGMQLDVMALGESLTSPSDPYQVVDDVALLLFGMPPTELVRQRMLDELLQGAEPWEWSIFDPNAPDRLQDLITLALRLPDAQSK